MSNDNDAFRVLLANGAKLSAGLSVYDRGVAEGVAYRKEVGNASDATVDRIVAALEDIAATLRAMHAAPDNDPVKVKHEWAWPSTFFGGGMFG